MGADKRHIHTSMHTQTILVQPLQGIPANREGSEGTSGSVEESAGSSNGKGLFDLMRGLQDLTN